MKIRGEVSKSGDKANVKFTEGENIFIGMNTAAKLVE